MNRDLKRLLVRACGPIDALARRMNGKTHYPPLHLRWEVGPLRGFESSAAEFRVYLRLFAGLRPGSSLLDIGCGCGQTALFTRDDLGPEGRYEGWDIFKDAIDWCEAHIAAGDPRFSFRHLDVKNGMYNPEGAIPASAITLPAATPFTIILMKSVFTHMLPAEVENYMRQLPGLLARGGRAVLTFFLLNDAQRGLKAQGKNSIAFQPHPCGASVADPHVPEAIVAYEEVGIVEMAARCGLRLAREPVYGSWTGNPDGLSHQDILIFEAVR